MEAQVWTLIAMMFTALVGLFFYVATRFDSLTGRLDEHSLLLHELKAQSTLHGEGLNRLDARVERLDTRVERLEGRVEHLDGRMDQMDGRMDNLEGAVRALGQSLGRADLLGREEARRAPASPRFLAFRLGPRSAR